jgi:hypothetical protein
MKRLQKGDQFHAGGNPTDPYTVIAVKMDGYVVNMESESGEDFYDTKTIHKLFDNRNWILKRKQKPVFSDKEGLFTI